MTNGDVVRRYVELNNDVTNIKDAIVLLENIRYFKMDSIRQSNNKSVKILFEHYLIMINEIERLKTSK